MTTLSFTGAQKLGTNEEKLRDYLSSSDMHLFLREFDMFVTGGCIGWDAFVGRYLALTYPHKTHLVVCPANRSKVDPWWLEFDLGTILVKYMEEGTDYRDRNTEMVNRADHLFYCAEYPEDDGRSKRSGTWMTVRIGRRAGIYVNGIILNQESA